MKENVSEARAAVLAAKGLLAELDQKSAIVRAVGNLLEQAAVALALPLRKTSVAPTPEEEGT